jgi:hypothetical protein
MHKKIYIIWKYNKYYFGDKYKEYHLIEDQKFCVLFKEFSVKGKRSEKSIIAIYMSTNPEPTDYVKFDEVLKFVNQKLSESLHEYLILIHHHFDIESKKLNDLLGTDRYELFEKGAGVIYDRFLDKTLSIIKIDAFEGKSIKETVFDDIWIEYNVKKKIKKIKGDIHKIFIPLYLDIEGLKKVDERKRAQYLAEIYYDHKRKVTGNTDYFKNLLVKFFNIMVDQQFNQNLKPCDPPKEGKISLMNIRKDDPEKSKKKFEDTFKDFDIGLVKDGYTKVNLDAPIVMFLLGMDKFLNDVAESKIEDVGKTEFLRYVIDSIEGSVKFKFSKWYYDLIGRIEKFEENIVERK